MTLNEHVNASLQKTKKKQNNKNQKRQKQNKISNKTVYEAQTHSLAVFIWLLFLL